MRCGTSSLDQMHLATSGIGPDLAATGTTPSTLPHPMWMCGLSKLGAGSGLLDRASYSIALLSITNHALHYPSHTAQSTPRHQSGKPRFWIEACLAAIRGCGSCLWHTVDSWLCSVRRVLSSLLLGDSGKLLVAGTVGMLSSSVIDLDDILTCGARDIKQLHSISMCPSRAHLGLPA